MTNRVSGNSRGRSYIGTNAPQPPNMNFVDRAPTEFDRENVQVGDFWINTSNSELWYLSSLANDGITTIKGKQAHWVNLTGGGGGGSIQLHPDTGSPDVTPEADVINIFGGLNIGTTGPGAAPQNTLTINLDTSISQPNTNTSGSTGLYSLGGADFMHNFGTRNTFLGGSAGNRTLVGATDNTGIGQLSLRSLTSGDRNTAVGQNALNALTTGGSNTAIGVDAGALLLTGSGNLILGDTSGTDLTGAESNNILLYNAGVTGEDDAIRIGTDILHDATYIAGIAGSTVGGVVTPKKVVNIDNSGQLGQVEFTSSGATVAITQPSNGVINFEAVAGGVGTNPFAFSYVLDGQTALINAGVDYQMGSTVVLTQLFDVGNNFYPGDGVGAPAVFTAPVTGKYYFEFYVYAAAVMNAVTLTITTTQETYVFSGGSALRGWYSVIADMAMGDTAIFSVSGNVNPGQWQIQGNGFSSNQNSTRISGFLIPEGASGGNFSQPFLGIQQVDAANVTGGGVVYELGSAAAMDAPGSYDVGNNFDPGDGLGTPASFTAPATGIYSFTVSASGAPGVLNVGINSPSLNYLNYSSNATPALEFTTSLTALDVVTFVVEGQPGLGANSVSVFAINPGSAIHPASVNATFVSGYRIA